MLYFTFSTQYRIFEQFYLMRKNLVELALSFQGDCCGVQSLLEVDIVLTCPFVINAQQLIQSVDFGGFFGLQNGGLFNLQNGGLAQGGQAGDTNRGAWYNVHRGVHVSVCKHGGKEEMVDWGFVYNLEKSSWTYFFFV